MLLKSTYKRGKKKPKERKKPVLNFFKKQNKSTLHISKAKINASNYK